MIVVEKHEFQQNHSEDLQDIISSPPAWLLRWGITVFFMVLLLILSLSAFIQYPDTVKTQLKINSFNSPKPVITRISGKLNKLLVHNGDNVVAGQTLAYLESTANHKQVLMLLEKLNSLKTHFSLNREIPTNALLEAPAHLQLGELQSSYQLFYEAYLLYKANVYDGINIQKRGYLRRQLTYITFQKKHLLEQKEIHERDFKLAQDEYIVHKILADKNVETTMELRQQESKLLAKKSPLAQTETSILSLEDNYLDKTAQIAELNNQITEEKAKFVQALNSIISEIQEWKVKYVLTASQIGKLAFTAMFQENQTLDLNEVVFYISNSNERLFGEINIQQYNMGKIKVGQKVLVKLKSYPFQEYGIINGYLSSVSEIPVKDSLFISTVKFDKNSFSGLKKNVTLRYGMLADAEIITEEASLLKRILDKLIRTSY